MGQTVINGDVFGETNQQIQVVPKYNSGILVATIIIDGESYPIYIPDQNSQNGGNNTWLSGYQQPS